MDTYRELVPKSVPLARNVKRLVNNAYLPKSSRVKDLAITVKNRNPKTVFNMFPTLTKEIDAYDFLPINL